MRHFSCVIAILTLTACASSSGGGVANRNENGESEPAWVHNPVRSNERERIVYVGAANALTKEVAVERAEALALEDIANECSLIPKSTRVESRYSMRGTYEYDVHVKVSTDASDCESAKSTEDPVAIRFHSHHDLMEQLLAFQDKADDRAPGAPVLPPEELPSMPDRDSHWDDTQYFYTLRQALAYQKQIAALSPPDTYGAFSSEAKQFIQSVKPFVQRLHSMQLVNSSLREKPLAWSQLPDRPRFPRPEALRKRPASGVNAPAKKDAPKAPPPPARKDAPKKIGPVRPPPSNFPKRPGRTSNG